MTRPRRPATPAGPREAAHAAALRLLAARERSAAELRQRLRTKGFDGDIVEVVLERLREAGLQDDRRFADSLVESAVRDRGYSSHAVHAALRRKGVDQELAAQVSAASPEADEERALAAARKRAAQLASLAPDVRMRRLVRFLARRGYPEEVCERAAREASGPSPDCG